MDAVSFFLVQHGSLHAAEVTGGRTYADSVFAGLTDAQMRTRAGKRLNSLAWLLWHMARTEDAAVNPVVAARDQVLDEDWIRRMNVPQRTIGTGMTSDEVTAMSAHADIAAVRAYRSAVGRRTQEVVRALRPEAWDEIVEAPDIRRAAAAGAFRDWVEGVSYPWLGWTRAEQLASSALPEAAWEEIVGATDTGRAAAAGAFGPSTGWRADVGYTAWQDQSRAAAPDSIRPTFVTRLAGASPECVNVLSKSWEL